MTDWTGPPRLGLALSPALAAADPGALRRRAAEHAAEADALFHQAEAVRSAVADLVPAVWRGQGALSFAAIALVQADTLALVADSGRELGTALAALAVGLEAARAEASAAVAGGARLDEEVAADSARAAGSPVPPAAAVGVEQARLDHRFAAASTLTQRLAVAEEQARRAWDHASATFDFVAYRLPHLAEQMSGSEAVDRGGGDGWSMHAALTALTAADWRALVGSSPICMGGGYRGGGAMIGPDGRRYPLVIPWVEQNGIRWTGDQVAVPATAGNEMDGRTATLPDRVGTLDGADPGWRLLGVRTGIESFGPRATTATKAAIIAAGLAGGSPTPVGRLRPDLLGRLQLSPVGVPSLPPVPQPPPPLPVGKTGQSPRSALVREPDGSLRWVADTSREPLLETRAESRELREKPPLGKATPVAPNVLGLAESGLSAAAVAARLDDVRSAAYRVSFEENLDGRLRARLTLYQVRTEGPGTAVLPRQASVNADGKLTTEDATYRPPRTPVLQAAPKG